MLLPINLVTELSFTFLFFAEPIELGRRVLFFGVAALEATLELDLI